MAIEITVDTPILKGEKGDKGDTGSFSYGKLEDIVKEHLNDRFSDVDADLALKVDIDNDKDLVDKDIITSLSGLEGWVGENITVTGESGKPETKKKNLVNVLDTKIDDTDLNTKFEVLETSLRNSFDERLEAVEGADMRTSVYDPDGDGFIDIAKQADNADTVNNLTVETAVPENAVFTDTTYNEASITEAGLMSSTDKMKLDGVAKGATRVEVLDVLDSTEAGKALSSNQGKILKEGIDTVNNSVAKITERLNVLEKPQKILWSGSYYMSEAHTATLSEKVSEQKNGIVLMTCLYGDGQAKGTDIYYMFVPKVVVPANGTSSYPVSILSSSVGFGYIGVKYLRVYNGKVTGHETNEKTGTTNGISWKNNAYVLYRIIGV